MGPASDSTSREFWHACKIVWIVIWSFSSLCYSNLHSVPHSCFIKNSTDSTRSQMRWVDRAPNTPQFLRILLVILRPTRRDELANTSGNVQIVFVFCTQKQKITNTHLMYSFLPCKWPKPLRLGPTQCSATTPMDGTSLAAPSPSMCEYSSDEWLLGIEIPFPVHVFAFPLPRVCMRWCWQVKSTSEIPMA